MPADIHEPCGQPVVYVRGEGRYVHVATWNECPAAKAVAVEEGDA
jgi:hypothetical protein